MLHVCSTPRMATMQQVIDQRRGTILQMPALPGWALKGIWHSLPFSEGSFTKNPQLKIVRLSLDRDSKPVYRGSDTVRDWSFFIGRGKGGGGWRKIVPDCM